jgi:hypothetical protein
MRQLRPIFSFLWVLIVLMLSAGNAPAQDKPSASASTTTKSESTGTVILKEPTWQAVLDKLFGTPESGLLDGKKAFDFRAEDVKLTTDQSAGFFTFSTASAANLAALIEAAEALHGQIRMEGTIDGKPFEFKLAGREIKIEGLNLTAAERERLSNELRGISGLREAKIDALVDGKATTIVIAGGKERISLVRGERPENGRGDDKQKLERPAKIDIEHRADIEHRVEIDRGVRADTRVEHGGRIGGAIEKPELPRIRN